MTGEAIISISAATVALTQLAKWSGVPDRWGPLAVLVLAALGVALWGFTQESVARTDAFNYFSGWIAVATSAAGVFGFTRAAASSVTRASPPPGGGAGSSPTVHEPPTPH
jgi:hypothetical protein